MIILANAAPGADPLSGGSGWVGAGLLGLVLAWLLLKYLPDKDRQLITFVDGFNEREAELRREFTATVKELGASINSAIDKVVAHCREELTMLAQREIVSIERIEEAVAKIVSRRPNHEH